MKKKSGSVAIKGQFTVQKAALEDLSNSNNVERGLEFSLSFLSFSFVMYPSAEGLERPRRT